VLFALLPSSVTAMFDAMFDDKLSHYCICVLLMTVFTLPFLISFKHLPHISHLSFLSLLAFVCIILCFVYDFMYSSIDDGVTMTSGDDLTNMTVIGIPLFPSRTSESYTLAPLLYTSSAVFNSLNIYNTLRFPSVPRGIRVCRTSINVSYGLAAVVMVVGCIAYLDGYGGKEKLNIFTSDGGGYYGLTMARYFYLLFCYFKFPFDILVAKSFVIRLRKNVLRYPFFGGVSADRFYWCMCCFYQHEKDRARSNTGGDYRSDFFAYQHRQQQQQQQQQQHASSNRGSRGSYASSCDSNRPSDIIPPPVSEGAYEERSIVSLLQGEPPLLHQYEHQQQQGQQQQQQQQQQQEHQQEDYDDASISQRRGFVCTRRSIRLGLTILVWILAIALTFIPKISEYIITTGSVTGTMLAVVIPAMTYFRLRPVDYDYGESTVWCCGSVPNVVWGGICVFVGILGMGVAGYEGVRGFM
jgi:hypothetical protein